MYTWRELVALYRLTDPAPPTNLQPRYNICPTTTIDAVIDRNGSVLEQMRWGLVPSWWTKPLKELRLATFNARAETVAEKPFFRSAFKHTRCLIPASGYYEWQTVGKEKQPYYFTRRDGQIITIAGLWSEWKNPETGKPQNTCTMIITEPNKFVAEIHDRMPVILEEKQFDAWLTDAFATLTGRVGWAFGPNDRILGYVKGGGAWAHSNVDMVINRNVAGVSGLSSTSINPLGWTVGVGAEYAMRAHWSVKAEYDYMNFGSSNVLAPSPSVNTVPNANPIPTTSLVAVPGTPVSQQVHVFKIGMNYKFGPDGPPFPDGSIAPMSWATRAADGWGVGWQFEGGVRYWYSSGRFQKDIGTNVGPTVPAQNPTANISRLTWDNLTGNTAEVFARFDTPVGWFVKGFVGGGNISGGKINDEDWGQPFAVWTGYSNTQGDASGNLRYGTIDLGYNVLHGAGYKIGFFGGYNYYRDNKSSYSCAQIALPASGICSPSINGFVLSEDDTWQSARVGGNAEIMLGPRWKLVGDVAVLPYVKLNGQDNHPLRPFIADEWGTGIGTQAELFLNGYLTPQISVGVGGRYWAMWTNKGTICIEGQQCPFVQDVQYKTERYGVSRFCTVNVTMVGGRVTRMNYVGPTGGLLTPNEQCAFAVANCTK